MNKNVMAIVGVAVVVLVGGLLFMMTQDDSSDTDSTTNSNQTTNTSQQTTPMEDEVAEDEDIVALAVGTDSLSTLVSAVQAADLVETLQSVGPFTVFAPTNDAFAALPAGTLDTLLMPENKQQLASILTYHVVAGEFMSSDLSDGQQITTVQGGTLEVEITNGSVYIVDAKGTKAKVATPDVAASNGVVHVISSVLLPE